MSLSGDQAEEERCSILLGDRNAALVVSPLLSLSRSRFRDDLETSDSATVTARRTRRRDDRRAA